MNKSRLVNVPQVAVSNGQVNREAFLNKQLEPLLKPGSRAFKVEELLLRVDAVTRNFVTSGSVENVLVRFEALPKQQQQRFFYNPTANNINNNSIDLVPIFHLIPVKRFFAKTGTNVGNGEGSGYLTLQLRNFLKGGENLIFDATIGTRTRTSYLLNLNFPINNNPYVRSENLIFMNSKKNEWTSHDQILKGFSNKIIKYGIGDFKDPKNFYPNVAQELSIENIWRAVSVIDSAASDHVLLNCGDDFKSSLVYNIRYDSRNSRLLPKLGKFFKFQLEYAPGLVNFQKSNFVKCTTKSLVAAPLSNKTFINFSFRTGILHNLNKVKGYTHLMDKFYLGGPTDIRGFTYNGLGPRAPTSYLNSNYLTSGGDRLGGNLFYSAGLSLLTTIPKLAPTEDYNWKLHFFANAGKLINFDYHNKFQLGQGQGHGTNNSIDGLVLQLKQPSVSIGAGVLYNHPAARFELNFTVPVLAHESDSLRKGIQYGIGLSFL